MSEQLERNPLFLPYPHDDDDEDDDDDAECPEARRIWESLRPQDSAGGERGGGWVVGGYHTTERVYLWQSVLTAAATRPTHSQARWRRRPFSLLSLVERIFSAGSNLGYAALDTCACVSLYMCMSLYMCEHTLIHANGTYTSARAHRHTHTCRSLV